MGKLDNYLRQVRQDLEAARKEVRQLEYLEALYVELIELGKTPSPPIQPVEEIWDDPQPSKPKKKHRSLEESWSEVESATFTPIDVLPAVKEDNTCSKCGKYVDPEGKGSCDCHPDPVDDQDPAGVPEATEATEARSTEATEARKRKSPQRRHPHTEEQIRDWIVSHGTEIWTGKDFDAFMGVKAHWLVKPVLEPFIARGQVEVVKAMRGHTPQYKYVPPTPTVHNRPTSPEATPSQSNGAAPVAGTGKRGKTTSQKDVQALLNSIRGQTTLEERGDHVRVTIKRTGKFVNVHRSPASPFYIKTIRTKLIDAGARL